MATTPFSSIRSVTVPVTDLDRSKALFLGLGCSEVFDTELQPGFRWIELALPGGGAGLSLVATVEGQPVGIDTGIRLETIDARAAREAVQSAGLEADELLDWDTAPLMFSFVDPDGNRFYVLEAG